MAVKLYDYQIAAVEKMSWKRKVQNSVGLLLSSEWWRSRLSDRTEGLCCDGRSAKGLIYHYNGQKAGYDGMGG